MIAAEDIVITATNPVEFSAGSIISDSNISVDKNETWVGTGGYTNIGLIQTGKTSLSVIRKVFLQRQILTVYLRRVQYLSH